jgi:hypothetical protein
MDVHKRVDHFALFSKYLEAAVPMLARKQQFAVHCEQMRAQLIVVGSIPRGTRISVTG